MPSAKRVVRTVFWTLWIFTVAFTAYGLAVESLGIGLFLHGDHAPKWHMRGEARLASSLSIVSALALAVTCFFIRRQSRPLWWAGLAALAFWFFYLAIPRF